MKKKLLSLFAALVMTATVSAQVTYTCTAGTDLDAGEGIAKLFDNNVNTKYCGNPGSDVYALVTASEPVYVWGYDITTANDNELYGRLIGKWTLYGTNDPAVATEPTAEGWVALSDLGRNNMIQRKNFYTQRFFCEKNIMKPFKYFKLVLNESQGYKKENDDNTYYDGMIQLSEFKLLGETNRVVSYKWKASSQDNSKKAVDLLLSQKWEGSNLAGNYVTIETSDGQAYAVKSYSFTTHDDGDWKDRAPKSWKIEGSNDNSNWTLIDERTDDDEIQNENYTTFEFTPDNTTDKFRYIKLTLNAMKSTGWTQVGEFHVLSTSDVSDAQYYTNLVNNAKATKAGYEDLLGENDPWCQEYATFFAGLDLDGVLATAISSGEYAALEAKLAEAENNAIAQAMNQFVNGANYAAFAGSADKCWGDGHYSQLFDGKDGCEGRAASKWGGNNFPQYVIFRVKTAFAPFFYKLVTGNDTATNTGRNWKTWSVYGGNFASFSAAQDSTTSKWTLLDERVNVSEEYLPMKNFYPATFDFNKGVNEDYMYYMVKVFAPHSGSQQQMSEMYLCTQAEFEAIRQPLVEELAEFAAGLDALVVESDKEADKENFATLYAELQTTADAVRLTKVYNDLVALKEALEKSAAFVAGEYYVAINGSDGWGDGHYSQLVDGKTNTKWGGSIPAGGAFVIFRTYAATAYNQYMLTTGGDTGSNSGRNWKTWKIYGANVKGDMDELATRDLDSWTLIDEKTNIGQDQLPAANTAPAYFSFTNPKSYKYFKIEVESAYSGDAIQMAEFKLLTDEDYAAIRGEYASTLQNLGLSFAGQFETLDISEELKTQIMNTAMEKINAVATAAADNLLPSYNDALNYINVEAPALIAQAQLPALVDGVYQLATPSHLVSFATYVNAGNLEANAVLVNDIDMNGKEWSEPIGNWATVNGQNNMYKGHFDGQGHAITNFTYTTTREYHGLFGVISTGALIENFSISGTITNPNNSQLGVVGFARDDNPTIRNVKSALNINNGKVGARVGGILGVSYSGSTVNVDRCTYSGTLDGNDNAGNGNYGGIVGYTQNAATTIVNVTNCLFDGKLINTAATPGNCTFGGIVGYVGANPKVTLKNCLSIGTVQSAVTGQFFGAVKSNKCSIVNSYYQGANVNGSASTVTLGTQEATQVTDEQLASEKVVLALGIAFRQNLGTDAYPVLDATHNVVTEISDAGYSTLYVDNADLTVPTGVTAFTGEFEETWLKLNAVEGAIAAAEPVVLKGAAGIYSFVPTTGAVKAEGNVLKGAADDISAAGLYILAQPQDEPVGFYKSTSGTIKAGKAYLSSSNDVKAFLFSGDDATGIEETLSNSPLKGENIFNLAGQRLNKMQKGINIVAGKKVLK